MYGTWMSRWNPNPITKFVVVGLMGVTVLHDLPAIWEWAIVLTMCFMYAMNGYLKEGMKSVVIFGLLFFVPNFTILASLPFIVKLLLSLLFVFRMFYLPFLAGKFLIMTSDVGTIITSMEHIKIPDSFSIPIAVMFRFFPSFWEEKNNIKMAMKIRGIKTSNPIRYIEYVMVPLLIISSTIADDISKAAQTKCIENPVPKTRYMQVRVNPIDFLYGLGELALLLGGLLC